jgi:aminoglycoside phosphotransferase (APT) family kinase protein
LGLAAGDLAGLLGGEVTDLDRLLGGASRETWSFRLDGRPLVLRRDPPGALRGGDMRREATLLRAAASAGMPVPTVVADGDDFLVMEWLDGETIPRRILRDDRFVAARPRLVGQAAQAVARLHTKVRPSDVTGLPVDPEPLATLRATLDRLGEPHPALELGLARLAASRPASSVECVVHGDFRLGNWMVDDHGLAGVLDWELAHLGDPAEDLGWMCVRSWRFGAPLPVAGVGTREQLLSDYAAAGGDAIDMTTLRWWEAYGTLRWAVICVQQAATHLTGAMRSLELAAIGRRVCEVELDLLQLIVPKAVGELARAEAAPVPEPMSGPHDRPTADELLDAVQDWVSGLDLTGRDAFLARVGHRALDVVRRELALGPSLVAAHAARLTALGVASDAELAAAIRAGRDDDETVTAVTASVVDKLRVADPGQLEGRA